MSTKERRLRAFAEREKVFLDAARELIASNGMLNLQMQRVAHLCDYSVGTLYLHFTSKEDMLLALLTERASERIKLFQTVARWQAGTRERMLGFVLADVIFARQQPLFFHLHQYLTTQVISAATSPSRRQQAHEVHQPLAAIFEAVIREAQACGDLPSSSLSPFQIGSGLWALSEGIHTLVHAEGLLDAYRIENPYQLLFQHVNALLNGLNWQPMCDLNNASSGQQLIECIVSAVFSDIDPLITAPLFSAIDQDSQ
jgi:AcrR family transcriptional regulator